MKINFFLIASSDLLQFASLLILYCKIIFSFESVRYLLKSFLT